MTAVMWPILCFILKQWLFWCCTPFESSSLAVVDITLDMAKHLFNVQVLLPRPCLYRHVVKVSINNAVHMNAQMFITIFVCSCFERAVLCQISFSV